MEEKMSRTGTVPRSAFPERGCRGDARGHDWRILRYYCPYIDGYAERAFECNSCGDRPFCGGQQARRVCARCGIGEWFDPAEG